MNISTLIQQAHSAARKTGWWDAPVKSFGECIALVHSELSESLEQFREGRAPQTIFSNEHDKPEGVAVELADVVIRIADMCGYWDIDLEHAIHLKMEYNKLRSYRHGGKKL